MLKILPLLMIAIFAFAGPGYSSEEEEAQTRPNPQERNTEVSREAQEMQSSKVPSIIAGRLFKENEGVQQTPTTPHVDQSAVKAVPVTKQVN